MKMFKILVYGIIMALVVTAFTPAVIFLGLLPLSSLIKGVVGIVLIATAIVLSSMILAKGKYDKPPKWSWTLQVALAFLVFAPAVVLLGTIPLPVIIMGLIAVALVALAIVLTDKILAKGQYKKYPPIKWTLSTVAALAPFALGMAFLGPLVIPVALGAVAVLIVAASIVAVSKILAKGSYDKFPTLEWSKGVVLSMGFFGAGMLGMGTLILGSLGLGLVALAAGREAVLMIAQTTVDAAEVLGKGSFVGGPTKAWAEGVSIALGAFSMVYQMLADNAFWSFFGMGGIGPNEFAAGIKVVTKGIVVAAKEFEMNKAAFKEGPSEKWSKGVGLAIGAFAPVYKVLLGEGRSLFDKVFGGPGPKPEDMAKAIRTISSGIIVAAQFFAKNKVAFKEGNYPSKKWGVGVGKAIGAFAPVFQLLAGKSWYQSSDDVIRGMVKAIKAVSRAIISSGEIFRNADDGIFNSKKAPTKKWASGVSAAIEAFAGVFEYMFANQGWFTDGDEVIDNMTYAIRRISYAIADVAREFGSVGEQNWKAYPSSSWGSTIKSLNETMTDSAMFLVEKWGESDYEIGWGLYTMANKMKKVAKEFNGSDSWQAPDKKWGASVQWNMRFFSKLAGWMDANGSFIGTEMLVYTAEKMSKIAKKLHSAKRAFDYTIPENFLPNLRKNMLDFQSLVHELAKNEEKGLLEMMGDAFGKAMGENDPIIQMANRMVALAKGYSALAKSLTQLGSAMKSVNAKSLTELGSLTKGVAGKPVEVKKEEKQGLFQSMKSSFTGFGGGDDKKEKSGFQAPPKNKKNSISYLSEKMEEMIKVMQSIKKDTNSLDSQVMKMSDGKIKREVDSAGFGLDN
jgi:hypothetical protein